MLGVDPTRPETVAAARKEGERQVNEIIGVLRRHPAFAEAKLDFVGTKLGVREGRRIMGDYVLTAPHGFSVTTQVFRSQYSGVRRRELQWFGKLREACLQSILNSDSWILAPE